MTTIGDFVFAAVVSDDEQGRFAAAYALRDLKRRRPAVIATRGDAYSMLVAGAFRESAAGQGGTIVANVEVARDHSDLGKALAAVKAAHADVVFAPVYYDTMIEMAPSARAYGLDGSVFLGADGWDSEFLWTSKAADALEGARFVNHWIGDAAPAASRSFVSAYVDRFGHAPSSLAALGFESTGLLADAIGRAEPPTRRGVREALAETQRFEGLLGPESMGPTRRLVRPLVVAVIHDGAATFAATVGP